MPPLLESVGLIVSDMADSVAFYRRLGIEFPDPPDPKGHGHVEAKLPGSVRFALDTVESIKSFDQNWRQPVGGDRIRVAFLCDSPAEVDALYKKLVDEGVESYNEPWDASWGDRYAQVKDPDGNVVDLFAPLAPRR